MTTRVRVLVSGQVQGVFFRAETQAQARRLGLTGWVRNRPDGRVEAEFQGAAGSVEEAVTFCHEGPRYAEVERVDIEEAELVPGEHRFTVR